MTSRERAACVVVALFGALVGGAVVWALGRLFGDDQGWFGFAFFAVGMFVVSLYEPELVKLFRRMND